MAKFKAIIFDMGGVVAEDVMPAIYEEIHSVFKMNVENISPIMHKYLPDLQKDYISSLDFWKHVCKDLEVSLPDATLSRLYDEPFRRKAHIKKSMLELIAQLKKKYKIGLITNTIHEHYQFALENGWYHVFDVAIASNVVKARKPEKEIYDLALRKLEVLPQEAVFIDDDPTFLVPARELGITTIQFTSEVQLKKDLKKLKIL